MSDPNFNHGDESELESIFSTAANPLEPISTDAIEVLNPLPNIRAVLFDVYGTMVVSGSGEVGSVELNTKQHAICSALASAGIIEAEPKISIDLSAVYTQAIMDVHASKKHRGIRHPEVDIVDVWKKVIRSIPDAQKIHEFRSKDPTVNHLRRVAVEFEVRSNPTWPMPGALDAVRFLTAHRVPLGIVSNAQFYTPIMLRAFWGSLENLGFEGRFCTWSYRIGIAKPSTTMFEPVLDALTTIGIEPHQVLYVGNDMLNDIYTAKSLGLKAVLFAGDRRSLRLRSDIPECNSIEPNAVITHFNRLSKVLLLDREERHSEG